MADVKIDEDLLKKVKVFIQEGENKFDFPTVKSFVDRAVLRTLKDLAGMSKNKK
jgi:hypothetical protein